MAGSLAQSIPRTSFEGQDFIPIRVASIRLDVATNFDLYLQIRPGDPLVLYARRHAPFKEDSLRRLEQSNVQLLYIEVKDETGYSRYLENHLQDILQDDTVNDDEKARILHFSAQSVIKEVLDNPHMDGAFKRSNAVVNTTVGYLIGQPGALRSLVQTASFDYSIYSHSVSGCVYSLALAQRLGLSSPPRLRDFGSGALLRDVGMSQLDSSIAATPGDISGTQYEILKQHVILGEQLLREEGGMSIIALDVVRHHHERMNGTGYPDGLYGDQISPYARICAIADVFDALSTQRPHRDARGTFDALRLMRAEMSAELDQNLFRAFVEMMGNPG